MTAIVPLPRDNTDTRDRRIAKLHAQLTHPPPRLFRYLLSSGRSSAQPSAPSSIPPHPPSIHRHPPIITPSPPSASPSPLPDPVDRLKRQQDHRRPRRAGQRRRRLGAGLQPGGTWPRMCLPSHVVVSVGVVVLRRCTRLGRTGGSTADVIVVRSRYTVHVVASVRHDRITDGACVAL